MDAINDRPIIEYTFSHSYDITDNFTGDTRRLKNKDIQIIKKSVLKELTDEELALYKPKLVLIENSGYKSLYFVYAIQREDKKAFHRMFVFENTKLLKILDRRQQPLKSFTP